MNNPERSPERYLLSGLENQELFDFWIAGRIFAQLKKVDNPSIHFFGGQPGAGKSSAQTPVTSELRINDGYHSVAKIIGDELRAYHPKYPELLEENDEDAAYYTDSDSARWVERSIDFAVARHSHIVLEGTLRDPDITLGTASQCIETGYGAELHVMAVHEYVSRTRIFHRYLAQIDKLGHGRYTVPEAHDRAYRAIPDSLNKLAKSGLFRAINLYDANGRQIVRTTNESDSSQRLSEGLQQERNPLRVDTIQLLGDIDSLLNRLREHDRLGAIRDLESLRRDITQASPG